MDETQEESTPPQSPDKQEKMLSQSEVNELIGTAKHQAAERARREAEAQYNQKLAEQNQPKSQSYSEAGGGVPDLKSLKEDLRQEFKDEIEEHRRSQEEAVQREHAEKLVTEYYGKLNAAKDKYDDLEEVVGNIDQREFSDVIMLANDVDGTADIMYELGKSPDKLISMATAARVSPAQAKRMMSKMAASIKQNHDAQSAKHSVDEPLPRSKSSLAGTQSGQHNSVKDFKSADWLRG